MKRFCSVLVVAILTSLLIGCFPVLAETEYTVYDSASGMKESFGSYSEAYDYYVYNLDEYDNLILKEGDRVIQMEYGIVEFDRGQACSITVDYYSQSRHTDDYLNGCYGADAAYLGTDYRGERVYFLISGDRGYTGINNVILHPYEELVTGVSTYTVSDGKLTHNIRTQLDEDYYSYSLSFDDAPSYLKEDAEYFSYDGHHFYDDFRLMISDYRNGTYENSLNEEAHYSYFQYLPHRSLTNYTPEDMQAYLDDLGITGRLIRYTDLNGDNAADEVNRSQLYGTADSFFVYQYLYGCNAMMLLSSAISESSYGKSYQSFVRNNLYQTAAYESDAEREANRYDSIDSSIYAHAKYFISSRYSNHMRDDYCGTFFGSKLSGINANYSLDPYYGERNASVYYELDERLGRKDYDSHALGIIRNRDRVRFYSDADLDYVMFVLDDVKELSFVILGETEDAYKISIDHSFSDEYLYDFEKSTAYVARTNFDLILNEDRIGEYELASVTYDLNGGSFRGYDQLTLSYCDPAQKEILEPVKEGYEFIGYDESMKAQYRKIALVEIVKGLEGPFEYRQPLDLSDAYLKVNYEDSSVEIPITTDMVSGFDQFTPGTQTLHVSYNGVAADKQIEVSEELYDLRQQMTEAIERNDPQAVKQLLGKIRYPFSFAQIRTLDYELMQQNQRNYVINDETERYNLSISGLDLSLPDRKSFSYINDTYYVDVKDIKESAAERIYDLAEGYGFAREEGIDISFRFNYQDISLIGPAIVQLDLEDKRNDLVYTVYHLNEDGDIVKCRTTQSENYIQFMIEEEGPYLVLSKESVNEFDIRDNTEDLSYENMGYDNHKLNINIMGLVLVTLIGLIGIIVFYILSNRKEREWNGFKKSLLKEDTVQEEKPRN